MRALRVLKGRALLFLGVLFSLCFAGSGLNQVETEHFYVIFKDGQEYWAHKVIQAAEDVWDKLIVPYKLQDEYRKIFIQIKDEGDDANGYAIFPKNSIAIYPTHLNERIRSSDNWIRNVITHELAHIISLKAASRDGFLQNLEISKRSFYQNPNTDLTFRYFELIVPMWWIEGSAQLESTKNAGDSWDTFRDMFLRMATLENDLLNYVEMSGFDNRNSFYREMTYNQGFSLCKYIDSTYGTEAFHKIARRRPYYPHFSMDFKAAIGKGGLSVYNEWKAYLEKKYGAVATEVNKNPIEGRKLIDAGFHDMFPVWSPDGRYIAFVSNKDYEVRYLHLFIYDTQTGKLKKVYFHSLRGEHFKNRNKFADLNANSWRRNDLRTSSLSSPDNGEAPSALTPSVSSRVQWSPDGKKLYYSHITENSNYYNDIYMFDIEKEKEEQITWHARALDPALSPDGKTIAYVNNDAGMQNLVLVDADGKNTRFLTNFNNGTQLYSPCWTPDGKKIVAGIMFEKNREIVIVNADAVPFNRMRKLTDSTFFADSLNYQKDFGLTMLVATPADERDPCLSVDGKYLFFSSDKNGIFNIYRLDMETKKIEQVTNVVGGAFTPSVDKNGTRLLYTGFHAANYSIYELTIGQPRGEFAQEVAQRDFQKRFTQPYLFSSANPKNGQYRATEYKKRLTHWAFNPFISFEPAYIADSIGFSDLTTGIDILTGDLQENLDMFASAYVGKNFRNRAGPSWGAVLAARLDVPQFVGENKDYLPYAEAFIEHHAIRDEFSLEPEYNGSFLGKPPNGVIDWFNASPSKSAAFTLNPQRDTIVGVYVDDLSGNFRYNRSFTNFGLSANLEMHKYHTLGLRYMHYYDYLNHANIYDDLQRIQFRVMKFTQKEGKLFKFDSSSIDVTDDVKKDPFNYYHYMLEEILFGDSTFWNINGKSTTLLDYYDRYTLYKDRMIALYYDFMNVRPSAYEPDRVDGLFFVAQFFNPTYNLYYKSNEQSTIELKDKDVIVNITPEGKQGSLVSSVTETNDFFSLGLDWTERFPLPGNNMQHHPPKGFGTRHYVTGNLFLGTFDRKFDNDALLYPIKYRIAHYMKAYPYSFDPLDTTRNSFYAPYFDINLITNQVNIYPDSVVYYGNRDEDILSGNGIGYYNFEYTLHTFHGLTLSAIGMVFNGILITPFVEAGCVWNENWRDIDDIVYNFTPFFFNFKKDIILNPNYIWDTGLRVDVPFTFFNTWDCKFSFTWARRLSLEDKKDVNGNKLAKDRYIFAFTLN